jgi:hypothetical protein
LLFLAHTNYSIIIPPLGVITNHDSAMAAKSLDKEFNFTSKATDILNSLMKNRFSCRYYLPKPVDKSIIEEIIDAARYSPSGNNMQSASII